MVKIHDIFVYFTLVVVYLLLGVEVLVMLSSIEGNLCIHYARWLIGAKLLVTS